MVSNRGISRRVILLLPVLSAAIFPAAAAAAEASYARTFGNRNATGESLANAFFELLSAAWRESRSAGTGAANDKAAQALVKPYLDRAFLLQRASGERYTAETYVPADVEAYDIGDVHETRPARDIVVVRYSVRATETLPDEELVMSKDKAPRLSAFRWDSKDLRWKIAAHTNFDTPVAAICNRKPLGYNNLASPVASPDYQLGSQLLDEWFTHAENGSLLEMLHPQYQFQGADGHGATTTADYKAPVIARPETDRLVVTRNENLMTLSFYVKTTRTVWKNMEYNTGMSPRLFMFLKEKDGPWKAIYITSINPPKTLPEGMDCVPTGTLEKIP